MSVTNVCNLITTTGYKKRFAVRNLSTIPDSVDPSSQAIYKQVSNEIIIRTYSNLF